MKQLFQSYYGILGYNSEQSQEYSSSLHNPILVFNPKAQTSCPQASASVCATKFWTQQTKITEQATDTSSLP